MTYFIREDDTWVEFTGQAIAGIQWPQGVQYGREPEELEEMGIFQAELAIPEGKVLVASEVIDIDGRPGFNAMFADKPIPGPVDCPITMRQLRLGLREYGGKRANYIQSLIDDIPDEATQDAAQIWYDETTEVLWDNPTTQALIAMTDFTVEQAAQMWMAAFANIPR